MKNGMKKTIVLLLAACLVLIPGVCVSPAKAQAFPQNGEPEETLPSAEEKEYIGIISAMDNEIALLLEQLEIDHVDQFGGFDYHVGTLYGHDVVITRSGIGKVYAAAVLSAMLNHYQISSVLFTGIAGGVGDETNVLDEIVATRLVQHDYGTVRGDGFEWTYGNTGEVVGDNGYFYCDPDLVELACNAAVQILGEEHVFKGTIATGDQFISSENYVKQLQSKFDAVACEMEGASVAAVCEQYEIPYVVIRAMSDKADGKAHESYDNMGNIAADNSSRIIMEMLSNME